MRITRILATTALLAALSACVATPRALSVKSVATEKDVLLVRIELDSALAPAEYLELAEAELAHEGQFLMNPFFPGTPVYEVLYAFHAGGMRLASVQFRRSSEGEGELRHLRTLVYLGGPE